MSGHFACSKSCFDCKSTKNLRAIHNNSTISVPRRAVVSTAKVQKIWEQFTTNYVSNCFKRRCFDCKSTKNLRAIHNNRAQFIDSNELFRLQKYKKFESNSQPNRVTPSVFSSCFDCKSTKNLRAIHNESNINPTGGQVVSTAKVQKIWEQFTTWTRRNVSSIALFRLQKYKKFESNSQLISVMMICSCVVSTAKVQKIWEQFTTSIQWTMTTNSLFRLQKYKKFESNSQRKQYQSNRRTGCFDCKSTKNLRAIHNPCCRCVNPTSVVSTAKVQKIWEQFTTLDTY